MLKLRPLTPTLGAQIVGVDLREPQSHDVMAAIAQAWNEHGVLLFRDQHLSPDEQRRFSEYFGPVHRTGKGAERGTDFMHIGNVEVDGVPAALPNGEMWFHQDGCYNEAPMRQTFLYALRLPSAGGNTRFASTTNAYRRLPADDRERLLAYDIRFSYNYTALARDASFTPAAGFVQPLVAEHPGTGRPFLFCNRLMADEIVGLPPAESRALVERLCAEVEREEHVYEHVWRLGDFLMWDNLATAHARTDFDPAEERLLRRTTTDGVKLRAYRDALASPAAVR